LSQKQLDHRIYKGISMNRKLVFSTLAIIATSANPASASGKSGHQFLTGTTNTTCMSFHEADAGRTIRLTFPNQSSLYPKAIRIAGGQANINIESIFQSGVSIRLQQEFDVGYDEQGIEKPNNRYCIGQFDFNKDGIPELLVAIEDPEFDGMTGVSLNVFQYHPPLKAQDISRTQNWELIGKLTAPNILGNAKVSIKDISVTVPRNLRGFYYEISWVKGRFVETSDY
jgi:hypothetical protein